MRRPPALLVLAVLAALLAAPFAAAERSEAPGRDPGPRMAAPDAPRDPDPGDGDGSGVPGGRAPRDRPAAPTAEPPERPALRPVPEAPSPVAPPPPPPATVAGDTDAVEPGEVLVLSPSMDAAVALAQALGGRGYAVLRRQTLAFLGGLVLSAFRVPAGRSVAEALDELAQDFPDVLAGPNGRFGLAAGPRTYARALIGWPGPAGCAAAAAVGIVDTAVDLGHPALAGRAVRARGFLPSGTPPASADHGTAVTALLAGNPAASDFAGLLPAARVTVAAVFEEAADAGPRATTERVALALDWLGSDGAGVVNLSLTGPRDPVLETVVARVAAAGVVLVAAAGNGGPGAPPAYPAAYGPVIAVTAVDAASAAYDQANRGPYVEIAAPGVDVWSARAAEGGQYHSGTSFATPFVTAAAAVALAASPEAGPDAVRAALTGRARDLGEPGRDAVFGWGLVQAPPCPPGDKASQ